MTSINAEKDFIEIEKDLSDFFLEMSRTDVSIKVFVPSSEYGETEKVLDNEFLVSCMRQKPSSKSQEFLRTQFGVDESAEYQLIFKTDVLLAAGIAEINHDSLFCFGDVQEKMFSPLTPLINMFPFGNNEALKTIYIKEKTNKKQYSEVK